MSSSKGWIGVDLDGTLAEYDGWKGINHIGEPIPLMLFRVKNWLAQGKTVKIFTARVGPQREVENILQAHTAIKDWCIKHIGQSLDITATKDFSMVELWDDRAIQVEENTGKRIDGRE